VAITVCLRRYLLFWPSCNKIITFLSGKKQVKLAKALCHKPGPPRTKLLREFVMADVIEQGVDPLVVGVRFPKLSTTAFKLPENHENKSLLHI
jgi:hypothetical protein